MNVWLAEKAGSPVDREVYGIFSTPDRAREVCQGIANEYYFMVTRFEVDAEEIRWT